MLRHEIPGASDVHGKNAREDGFGTFPRCKAESLEQADDIWI